MGRDTFHEFDFNSLDDLKYQYVYGPNTEGGEGLTLDEYQKLAATTAIYPSKGTGSPEAISYLLLKLNGEAGETAEAFTKFLRGDYDYEESKRRVRKEIGDVLWYLSQIANELGDSFGDIAANNLRKLADRNERGVIRGSGDER